MPLRASAAAAAGRWSAVQTRNPKVDGKFVYAVLTTGVYCRPTCPSRRARRGNVVFFDNCADAERAGFRPCQRCNPGGSSPGAQKAEIIALACRTLESAEVPPSLQELALTAGLSPYHFHRLFKGMVGITPRQYAAAHRRLRMRGELRRAPSVTEAIYNTGYGSSSRFYEGATGALGMRPGDFRAQGKGVAIWHAVVPCPLGLALVAATERGICAVHLGNTHKALERELREEFPKARFVAPAAGFGQWVRAVVDEIAGFGTGESLPLDIRGTAFQQRVWGALRNVPRGQTATYSEIASRIGRPAAVRAVANACGANKVAVLVPCHRAVRADGKISGYRWGRARKHLLLRAERGAA